MSPFEVSVWRRSQACQANGACVELAGLKAGGIGVRDAKQGEAGSVLAFSQAEFRTFVAAAKNGDLDAGR